MIHVYIPHVEMEVNVQVVALQIMTANALTDGEVTHVKMKVGSVN